MKHYPLNNIVPVLFLGDEHGNDNNWSGLPELLRKVADYLDEHPEVNGTSFFDLTIGRITDCGEDDAGYFTATLYADKDEDVKA